jgi:hypothetical protein
MPPEDRPHYGSVMEYSSFDDLARGVAKGTISRSGAIKIAGAALLGALLVPFSPAPAEAANPCEGKHPLCSRDPQRCKGKDNCVCAKIRGDGKKCVNIKGRHCPRRSQCNRTSDCRGGQVCVDVSGCCGKGVGDCLDPC